MGPDIEFMVIGATGYLGSSIYSKISGINELCGTSSSPNKPGLTYLDLTRPEQFDYKLIGQRSVVLLTAAISAPDICANEYERALALNVTGTSQFISKVISLGGRVIFFSSDTVFGENNEKFDENAPCKPAGEYAEMKREVEKRFVGNPLFKSIRLSYVFSREDKFTKYLSGCAERGEEAELFHPFYRAIVHRDDVIEGALALAQRWDEFPQQVINFGGPEVLSRIDFAECLKHAALPRLKYRVTEPGDEFFKNRPRVIAMSSNVLPELLGRASRCLQEAAQIEFASS